MRHLIYRAAANRKFGCVAVGCGVIGSTIVLVKAVLGCPVNPLFPAVSALIAWVLVAAYLIEGGFRP